MDMKKLVYLFFVASLASCGQGGGSVIKSKIDNKKSPDHLRIPGTRLYIIPPPTFKAATGFIGLQKGDDGMISVMDLVGGNFFTNAATFSKSEFEQRGVKVFDFRELRVNGYPAKLLLGQGEGPAKMYELVFGDTTFSTMVTGMYKVGDDATAHEIIAAINSIVYDKKVNVDPFETAYFSIDEKASTFKFLRSTSNMYVYSIGGIEHPEDANAPMLLVTQMPKQDGLSMKDVVAQMISQGGKYGFQDPVVVSNASRKFNGMDAYEAEIDVVVQGMKTRLYYFAVENGGRVVVVNGVAKKDIDNNVVEFKKAAGSLTFK